MAELPAIDDLLWTGNAAKARILSLILQDERPKLTVLDYGAGRGGGWPDALRRRSGIELVCFEPHEASASALASALSGLSARVLSEAELVSADIKADYIVSFSVLEHVHDRASYLANAKRQLAPDGVFHLNYDDGHFRTALDLDEARDWKLNVTETVRNRIAGVLPKVGQIRHYQARVQRDDIDRLIAATGLAIVEERYENLLSLKTLAKTIPPGQVQEFTRWWIGVEDDLNARFRARAETRMGDDVNLWRVMASRTLVLKHA
jgi:SAM-dependent methyltransferase